jgi:predicted small lipoprotein YifL
MRFIIVAALALSLAGCGWWGSDEPAPTPPAEPAPVTETTKPVAPDAIDKDGVYNTEPVRKELAKQKRKQKPVKRPTTKPVVKRKPAPAPVVVERDCFPEWPLDLFLGLECWMRK